MDRSAIIERAVELLRAGELVAVPTETVYGLAADATSNAAVARIFAAKGRPADHPLIAHLAEPGWLGRWTPEPPKLALRLAEAFWPGPLTLIVRRGERIPSAVTGGRDTLAVRVPKHPLTRDIIAALERPIAAPSANRFGSLSPTTAAHVRSDLGDRVALVVDGGPCEVGVESTIVDVTGETPVIARPGGIEREELERVVGAPLALRSAGEIAAPGTLPAHYAPDARVVLVDGHDELAVRANALALDGQRVGVLAPASVISELSDAVIVAPLSEAPEDMARQLYAALRLLDQRGCEVIVATVPDERGLGAAIADRLRRAAHPR